MPTNYKRAAIHTNRPYKFMPYNPDWPAMFQESSKAIRKVFGEEIILLEHVGSTSVPGMWAKPQIDMAVTVKNFATVPKFYEAMQRQGYKALGDASTEGEEYFAKDTLEGLREVSVHILPDGHRWAVDMIDVRDYLREHPDQMERYLAAKRRANEKYPTDYTNYFKAKRRTVLEISRRAAKWRDRN